MKTKLLILVSLILTTAACSNGGGGSDSTGLTGTKMSAGDCGAEADVLDVDPEHLKVMGHGTAQKGESVRYRLNQACAGEKAVQWKMNTGKYALQTEKVMTKFEHDGQWVAVANVMTKDAKDPVEVSVLTVVASQLTLTGPQIGMAELSHHFELAIPTGMPVTSVSWNFGDGSPVESGAGPKDHNYYQTGERVVTVMVAQTDGTVTTLTHNIKILPATDGMECVRDLVISGPTNIEVGQTGTFSAFIPQCLAWRVRQVRWNFGDGSLMMVGNTLTHAYDAAGDYTVRVDLFSGESPVPLLTITRVIHVIVQPTEEPDPIPDPNPVPDPDPNPPPGPVCSLGDQRTSYSETFNETRECGVGGQQTNTYRSRIVEECKLVGGEVLRWVETSRTPDIVSEGPCTSMACELPASALEGVDTATGNFLYVNGKWYIPSGASKTFYSSRTPVGSCQEVAEIRTCDNGVIGGSIDHTYLSCNNGCPGVGSHGTTITDIIVGQEVVPKQCQFGETGATDIYQTLADKTCTNGSVSTSNSHRGGLITAGMCPTYSWTPSDSWTACSADCGGMQSQIYNCKNSGGEIAPIERCMGSAPVVTRVCDGNPEAVRRTEMSARIEEVGQSQKCPADQIGYTTKKREITTTKIFACIDHEVKQESQSESEGPWVEEKYCKDYAPAKCAKDVLSEDESKGRYLWMKKCAATVPMLKSFLDQYDYYNGGSKGQLTIRGNVVYATFMDAASTPEKKWTAPKKSDASCVIPATVYIAAICVVDCATPEQQVMGASADGKKLEYVHFENAWNEQFAYVAGLKSNASLKTRTVQKMPVDTWTATDVADHTVLNFTMESGRTLRVTEGHALVSADGRMKEAREFQVGDSLVQLGGATDRIVSLTPASYSGKVYNVYVQSADAKNNIVITNGYLTGSAFYAGEGVEYLNRRVLRSSLIRGVFN